MLFAGTVKELQHESLPFMFGVLRQIALLVVAQQAGNFSKPPQTRFVFWIFFVCVLFLFGMIPLIALKSFKFGFYCGHNCSFGILRNCLQSYY